MIALLVVALLLLLAVLISGVAERSVLSIAVLFLIAGIVLGQSGLGLFKIDPQAPFVAGLIELAIFSVLFTDSMSFDLGQIKEVWRLPGRALLLGMPLTFGVIALLAHLLAGLSWGAALLIGAILSPTDPIFAEAIVKRSSVPERLRQLLNVESGLNDGLALPGVVLMLGVLDATQRQVGATLGELALGLVIGAAVAYLAIQIGRLWFLPPEGAYKPLYAFAIALIVLALAHLLHANLFFTAFAAGVTIATTCPPVRDAFQPFGTTINELLKLTVLLVLGALLSLPMLLTMSWGSDAFAVLTIVLARPLVILLVLLGSTLSWPERLVAAWFGPKGFASIFYGLLVLRHGAPNSQYIFHLIALVIALSIVAHSSTDVLVARWLQNKLGQRSARTAPRQNAT